MYRLSLLNRNLMNKNKKILWYLDKFGLEDNVVLISIQMRLGLGNWIWNDLLRGLLGWIGELRTRGSSRWGGWLRVCRKIINRSWIAHPLVSLLLSKCPAAQSMLGMRGWLIKIQSEDSDFVDFAFVDSMILML